MTEFSFPRPAGNSSNNTDSSGFFAPPAGGSVEERIARLEKEIEELRHAAGRLEDPLRPVLLAAANADGTWNELTIVGGSVTAPTGSGWRACTSAGDPSKLVTLASNQTVLIEVQDKGDHYYVPVGGAVVPGQYLGMVYQVTAANTAGWDWVHAHAELP